MEIVGISAAIGAFAALLWSVKVQDEVNAHGGCPECGTPVPRFRRPASVRQALWGGWTCAICGTEMDRRGHRLEEW